MRSAVAAGKVADRVADRRRPVAEISSELFWGQEDFRQATRSQTERGDIAPLTKALYNARKSTIHGTLISEVPSCCACPLLPLLYS
jgi:hypothetical protein